MGKQRIRLTEGQLHNIIRKCVNEAFKSQKLQQMTNANGGIDTKGDVLPYNAYNGYAPRLSELTDDMIDDETGDFYDERHKNATTHNHIRFKNGKYAFLKPNAMSGDDSTNAWKQRNDRANAKRNSSLDGNEYNTAQNPELRQLYAQRKNFQNSANKLEQDYQNRRVSDDFYHNNKKRNSEISQNLNDRWDNAKMKHGVDESSRSRLNRIVKESVDSALRDSRLNGITDQIDWYGGFSEEHSLNQQQIEHLKELRDTVVCFGEAGLRWARFADDILKENGYDDDTMAVY